MPRLRKKFLREMDTKILPDVKVACCAYLTVLAY
jgi:hypothetical protein